MYCSNAGLTARNYGILRAMDEDSEARLKLARQIEQLDRGNPDYEGYPLSPPIQKLSAGNHGPSVNNFVCPHCKNDRVSQNERTCWKCGEKL